MIETVPGHQSDDKQDYTIRRITSQEQTPALPALCAQIHELVETFLHTEPRNERIRAVQAQSRISLDVIEEALQKYRWVDILMCTPGTGLADE
jgi:hypothetical protein